MSNAGRHKNIPTPELMSEYFEQYKRDTKNNPFKVHDYVGKDADEVYKERERCLSMEGFENWLDDQKIITDVSDYFENKEGRYTEFIPICRAIRRKIRQDQIEGGMAGVFNASITQRLNGLTDKSEQRIIQEQPLFTDED